MKKQQFEALVGGAMARSLTPDAASGLNELAHRLTCASQDDELFATAVRRASDEELRKLARFRLDAQRSPYLD